MKCGECQVATTNPKDKMDCYFCPFDKVDAFHSLHDCSHLSELVERMAELLKEQETVEHACEILRANGWTETEPICSECDAIHVVRCKDCIFPKNGICHNAKTFGAIVQDDWFCADGKRKKYKEYDPEWLI